MKYRGEIFRTDMAAVPHKVLRDLPSRSLLWYFYVVILIFMVLGGRIYVSGSRTEKGKRWEAKGTMFLYILVIKIVKYSIFYNNKKYNILIRTDVLLDGLSYQAAAGGDRGGGGGGGQELIDQASSLYRKFIRSYTV